jgi:hypothetical protein
MIALVDKYPAPVICVQEVPPNEENREGRIVDNVRSGVFVKAMQMDIISLGLK